MNRYLKFEDMEFVFECKSCGEENKIIFRAPTDEPADELFLFRDTALAYAERLERIAAKIRERLNNA